MENKATILVVDDDILSIEIYKMTFGEDYEVLTARDGKQALEILAVRQDIVTVVMDIYMPEMDGFEALKIIKEDKRLSRIPVLMCTASEDTETVVKVLELGATDCISKPYNVKIMKKRVKNTIEKEYLERVKVERTLENTTQELNTLIDVIPGGIAVFGMEDTQIVPIYFNEAVSILSGMSKEEYALYIKKDIMEIVYISDKERLKKEIQYSIENNIKLDTTFRIYHKSGSPVWIHFIATSLRPEKQPIFYAVIFDISEEKTAKLAAEQEAQKFRYLAEHDSLTGINNRKAFCSKTQAMIQKNKDKKYTLLTWDVEKFKLINDLFGMEVGNRILKTLAMHFASSMLGIGTYGRLGDDHFAICYPRNYCTPEQELERANSALGTLNINYKITVCMGVYHIEDVTIPVENMCDRANLALMGTKGNYLKNFAYYDTQLIEQLIKEQELCEEMEQALVNEEFQVYIQPKYNIVSNKIIGGESLIRWIHPKKGMIPPGRFIPLFETNGAIVKLDAFVWEKTCKLLHEWQEMGIKTVPVSVNVSRINFLNIDICDYISKLVKMYELTTKDIKLEVTESVYSNDTDLFYKELDKLQNEGFEILMDDFGSGYSSFNMLKEAPVDGLKIDLKFLSGSDRKKRASKILTAIMYMTKLIHMPVIAEGVETKEQVQLLKDINCDLAQGYYYSRPIPAEEFKQLLIEQQNQQENE